MDNLPQAPSKQENLHYVWNSRDSHFDIIDVSTGLMAGQVALAKDKYTYSPLIADIICNRLRDGETLTTIAKDTDMPSAARVYTWLAVHPEFKKRYDVARKQRAESFQDKALEIALKPLSKDEVPSAKLAVDTLKWAAEKNDPERFGKKEAEAQKAVGISITLHTGVLDSKSPSDIVVDEYGNFKGFGNEASRDGVDGETGRSDDTSGQGHSQDRWGEDTAKEGAIEAEYTEI